MYLSNRTKQIIIPISCLIVGIVIGLSAYSVTHGDKWAGASDYQAIKLDEIQYLTKRQQNYDLSTGSLHDQYFDLIKLVLVSPIEDDREYAIYAADLVAENTDKQEISEDDVIPIAELGGKLTKAALRSLDLSDDTYKLASEKIK
ncbi:hypothetical protein ACRHK7_06215 [Weissella tructae]|uniref:Uncharacterized protein n=2 Tax=Weissella TaxID=46255 RepID=A0A075U033_9LACO|nr:MULTISPECIES: hypothetical protein [Weissella]AIG65558.1 hypothetical protein WS08_0619 [Weissella tructae]AIM62872.1 hypothetical protein WS74_0620 [Weissella ceti]AIM64270.1 hypothetical protein WS105_0680 [Weissella ceti]ELA06984.1 hypothetical protein WCNC_05372 [Weissella ceti NC36]QVV90690.1 hypothetical protein KHQ32_03370 [Weissella tructae]